MYAQCLSAVNPAGGTSNLLSLEKHSLRFMLFYKYGYGNQYYNGYKLSDFDVISEAHYSYLGNIIGYGISDKLTTEAELGYFFNKTQEYNLEPHYTLSGNGLSSAVVSVKYQFYTNHIKRIYYSASSGILFPFSRNMQVVNGVVLPIELQTVSGAYGLVLQSFFVKENSERGIRYFMTNRLECYFQGKQDYLPGTAVFSSVFLSKHLMYNRLKGDWTIILQLRNETRAHDKNEGQTKESSGGTLFFIVPQINYVLLEKWYLSAMVDVPVWQYYNGTQMGTRLGLTFSLSRAVKLEKE